MPLDFQLKQTTFRYGLAEGDDPHSVPFGVCMTLENYVWRKSSRLEKRAGTDRQTANIIGGGTITEGRRLFTRNEGRELCLIDGTNLHAFYAGASAWATVGPVPDVGLTQTPILDPLKGSRANDTALYGNLAITAFIPGDPTLEAGGENVYAFVTNVVTGAVVLPVARAMNVGQTAQGVRVIVIGTTAVFVAAGATNANVYATTMDLSTFAIAAPTTIRTDRKTTEFQNWDARAISGSNLFVLAYDTTASGIRLTSYNTALAVQQSALQVATTPTQLAVEATSAESICVVYGHNQIEAYIANATTMATTAGPTSVAAAIDGSSHVGVCRYDATTYAVTYTQLKTIGAAPTFDIPKTESKMFTSAGAVVANTRRTTSGVSLASNPFIVDGECYVFALTSAANLSTSVGVGAPFTGNSSVLLKVYPGADDGTSATVDLPHPFEACADTLLGASGAKSGCLPVFRAASTTESLGSLPFIGTAPNTQTNWRCGLRLVFVTKGDVVPSDLWRAAPRGAETFIGAGALSVYDGGDVFDYGFNYAPVLLEIQDLGAATGQMSAGNYIYAFHKEYRSASGLLYRGPTVVSPIFAVAVNLSSTRSVLANVNVGNKKHAQTERLSTLLPGYRTVEDGTIPQRITMEPRSLDVFVDYGRPDQLFIDQADDADVLGGAGVGVTLASRPAIYTSGGVLDDQQPPAGISLFLHSDRLFVLSGDKRTWWYSKAFGDDLGVAPGFNVSFRVVLAGEQVAGASMDDKAIFFGTDAIHYVLGNGPAKDGTGSDFTQPIRIQSDVGCVTGRSVVSMPEGIMFQSERGIYLLGRNLSLEWIGRPVTDTLEAYPTVTSAVLVARRNEVRFTCNNIPSEEVESEGVVLVYNYVEKQWSTSRYAALEVASTPIADACIWDDCWTFVTPGGRVFKESDSHHLDEGTTYVEGLIETAWVSAAGPLAYHSVRNFFLTGRSHSDHDLTIEVGFDSDDGTYPQQRVFPATSPVVSVGPLEECRISIGTRRKCRSIRFKIHDSEPLTDGSVLGTGKGPSLEAMAIEVGLIKGDKTSATRKG